MEEGIGLQAFVHPAHAVGHHGSAAGGGFADGHAVSFGIGGRNEYPGLPVIPGELLGLLHARNAYNSASAEPEGLFIVKSDDHEVHFLRKSLADGCEVVVALVFLPGICHGQGESCAGAAFLSLVVNGVDVGVPYGDAGFAEE